MNEKTDERYGAGSPSQPLAGVRAFEIGTSVAAPYAMWLLAALGADVIKVERPGAGDDARQWGEIFPDGSSSMFQALNRDKRGITVDLKNEDERGRLRALLIDSADVVLQNLRPGHIERYGLDAATLRADNPRLVYCNIWAFGAAGPLKHKAGYDPLMQACGGLMSVTGETGRAPVRIGTSIIDMGTGMWCTIGILAALLRRSHTGEGCVVDASLYETALGWMTYHLTGLQASGENPTRRGSGAPGMAPYQAYRCADGYLMIAAPNDVLFARLCEVLGHPDWPRDKRFDTNQRRHANLNTLNALLEGVLGEHPRAYWRERLDEVGIPNAPEHSTKEMLEDPQTEALGIVQQMTDSALKLMGLPLNFDGERAGLKRLAPKLGEHNAELLAPPPAQVNRPTV